MDLSNLTAKDRANAKGLAIASALQKRSHVRGNLRIEIVDIEAIEGGIEVFARAWRNGQQLGFGQDGSVDIERFRIFNPPILVQDDNGDIVQVTEANAIVGKPAFHQRLREDPEEALLQVIEHNLSVMKNVHSAERIVRGKRGNTTSTFYPDGNPETSSVDGGVVYNMANPGTTWATIRAIATGSTATPSAVDGLDCYIIHATTSNQFRYIGRAFFLFDTSAIPDGDTISSATLSIFHRNTAVDNNPAQTYSISSATLPSNTDITTADIDQFGNTLLANEIAGSSVTQNAYNDFTLNASGIANITKTGVSQFSLRLKDDFDNTAPTWVSGGASGFYTVYADTTGTSSDPKLVVEHSAGGATRRVFNIS